MSIDLEEQYDKLYRYCYFKVRHRELAEDITQESILRFLEKGPAERSLGYLYTIARNLCIDSYRSRKTEPLEAAAEDGFQDDLAAQVSVRMALAALEETDQELLLLRYVNETPVAVIGEMYGISRFAVYRGLRQAEKKFKEQLGREDHL